MVYAVNRDDSHASRRRIPSRAGVTTGQAAETPTEDRRLSMLELEAWRSALVLADTLRALVSGAYSASTGLSAPDYLVLTRLSAAPENRLSGLKSLAAKLGWSASRLSHQLKRMSGRGLVDRVYEQDTGQLTITATPAAEEALRLARALHDVAVREHLLAIATPEELRVIWSLAGRVQAQHSARREPPD